jgi:hypothetical protein
MPGRFMYACPQVRSFYSIIGAGRSINIPLSPESRFCVPLVTITFKTWVFLNFAMERPSRFASLKAAIPRIAELQMDAGPMLRRVKLMNPFEIVQDRITQDLVTQDRAPPLERKVTNRAARSTPVCAACGSDDIICHATAQWSNEAQEWQLANTFNQPAHCNTCQHDGNLVWLTLS